MLKKAYPIAIIQEKIMFSIIKKRFIKKLNCSSPIIGCVFFITVAIGLTLLGVPPPAYADITPKKLAIYYGMPSQVNDALADLDVAVNVFKDYDLVVLGDSLEFPQYIEGAVSQIPDYVCTQNSHRDHNFTQQLIKRLRPPTGATQVYGYVSIGGENTARRCNNPPVPTPLTIAEIKARINAWLAMGVTGIFLDEAEYGFGSSRILQNKVVDYVHSKYLKVFITVITPMMCSVPQLSMKYLIPPAINRRFK